MIFNYKLVQKTEKTFKVSIKEPSGFGIIGEFKFCDDIPDEKFKIIRYQELNDPIVLLDKQIEILLENLEMYVSEKYYKIIQIKSMQDYQNLDL